MKSRIVKESYTVLKNNKEKLLTFSFIYIVIFVTGLLLNRLIPFGFLLVVAFALVPFLLSFQIMVVKACKRQTLEFSDFNQNYRLYYTPRFNGCYRVINTFLKTFLFYCLMSIVLLSILFFAYRENIEEVLNASQNLSAYDAYNYLNEELFNIIPYFDYYEVILNGFVFLYFVLCLSKNVFSAYFSFDIPVVAMTASRINRMVFPKISRDYHAKMGSVIWPSLIVYLIVYGLCTYIGLGVMHFETFDTCVLALSLSVAGCFVFFPIYLIAGDKIYCLHRDLYRKALNEMMSKAYVDVTDSKEELKEDQKRQIEDLLNQMKNEIDKFNESSKDEDKQSEKTSNDDNEDKKE